MSEKKDWSIYERLGVPVKEFYLLSNAIRVYGSTHGIDPKGFTVATFTEEMCEEWLAHHPNSLDKALADEAMERVGAGLAAVLEHEMKKPSLYVQPKVKPLGHKAPELQVSPSICGHKSDPDPEGSAHFCNLPGGHVGQHQDQDWYWFLTDWKPMRRTL